MIKKIRINTIYANTKNKEGKEFRDKNGKLYWKVSIQTDEYRKEDGTLEYIGALVFDSKSPILQWKQRDEVTVAIRRNDKGYLEFSIPTRIDSLEDRVAELERKFAGLEVVDESVDIAHQEPVEEIDPSSLPF